MKLSYQTGSRILGVALLAGIWSLACSSSNSNNGTSSTGGSTGTAGSSATGGSSTVGTHTGGLAATGGTHNTGGASSTSPATGGATTAATTATGGTTTAATSSTGGTTTSSSSTGGSTTTSTSATAAPPQRLLRQRAARAARPPRLRQWAAPLAPPAAPPWAAPLAQLAVPRAQVPPSFTIGKARQARARICSDGTTSATGVTLSVSSAEKVDGSQSLDVGVPHYRARQHRETLAPRRPRVQWTSTLLLRPILAGRDRHIQRLGTHGRRLTLVSGFLAIQRLEWTGLFDVHFSYTQCLEVIYVHHSQHFAGWHTGAWAATWRKRRRHVCRRRRVRGRGYCMRRHDKLQRTGTGTFDFETAGSTSGWAVGGSPAPTDTTVAQFN